MPDQYRLGSYYRRDDRSGRKVRAEDSRKEWNGAIVHERSWEQRHPQDFVRGTNDDQRADDARPTPTVGILGPLTTTLTAAAAAGATSLTVESSTRFSTGATVWVMLGITDGATVHRTTLASVPTSPTMTLVAALPQAAASGSLVSNITAASTVAASSL